MDSLSHTRVARLLLMHTARRCGVAFDEAGFLYGNLRPDLTGTYLTKRHYPSVMHDEVMARLRRLLAERPPAARNGYALSADLGELCHYVTDFFCYPHNDDIYPHGLLRHYVYEKRLWLHARRALDAARFDRCADPVQPARSADELIAALDRLHSRYRNAPRHSIDSDLDYIAQAVTLLLVSVVEIGRGALT